MDIEKILYKDTVDLELNTTDKLSTIKAIGGMLLKGNRIKSLDDFVQEVYQRETLGSTNMGLGIAVPHCNSFIVNHTTISIVRLIKPIDWDGGTKVNKIFLFAVSKKDPDNTHLSLISKIAEMLIDDDFVEFLNTNTDKEKLLNKIYKSLGGRI